MADAGFALLESEYVFLFVDKSRCTTGKRIQAQTGQQSKRSKFPAPVVQRLREAFAQCPYPDDDPAWLAQFAYGNCRLSEAQVCSWYTRQRRQLRESAPPLPPWSSERWAADKEERAAQAARRAALAERKGQAVVPEHKFPAAVLRRLRAAFDQSPEPQADSIWLAQFSQGSFHLSETQVWRWFKRQRENQHEAQQAQAQAEAEAQAKAEAQEVLRAVEAAQAQMAALIELRRAAPPSITSALVALAPPPRYDFASEAQRFAYAPPHASQFRLECAIGPTATPAERLAAAAAQPQRLPFHDPEPMSPAVLRTLCAWCARQRVCIAEIVMLEMRISAMRSLSAPSRRAALEAAAALRTAAPAERPERWSELYRHLGMARLVALWHPCTQHLLYGELQREHGYAPPFVAPALVNPAAAMLLPPQELALELALQELPDSL